MTPVAMGEVPQVAHEGLPPTRRILLEREEDLQKPDRPSRPADAAAAA